jgi:hypothetical protein
MTRKDQLFRIMAALDGHFAADGCLPADQDRGRQLMRHVVRMRDPLAQAQFGDEPLPSGAARKLEAYVNFGLGEK